MTEKRFILKADYDWWGVFDTTGEIKGEYNDCFSTDDVVDLLNEFNDEIEQLKQSYAQLKHRHSLLHDVCLDAECDRDRYHKDVLSLEKENEELKSEIREVQEKYEQLWMRLYDY